MHVNKRSRITMITVSACASMAVIAGTAGSAFAAPGAVPTGAILQHVVSAQEVTATLGYWTPARMHAAVSARFVDDNPDGGDPPLSVSAARAALTSGATSIRGTAVPVPKVDPSIPVPGFTAPDHLGVVFFRSNGVDQRCTGNVVVSDSGDVVSTSGRCVSAIAGKFVSNLAFVPEYDGTAPKGVWAASVVTAQSGWVVGRAVDYDTAFFQVQSASGQTDPRVTLSSTVGASGVQFTGEQDDDDYQVSGYATDPGSDPDRPVTVASTAEPNPWANEDYAIEGLEWDARAGVSGSPWISTDADPVVDVESGMTSFAYKQFTHDSFGPQWTSAIRDLYRTAASAS